MPELTESELHAQIAGLQARIAQLEQAAQAQRSSELRLLKEVAERERADAALRDSEERMRLAQQVAHIGTFEWNIQTGVTRWTPELEAMYGLAPGTFAGTREAWEQLVHPDEIAEAHRRAQLALDTGIFDWEWRIVCPDGTLRWLAGRASLFRDEAGNPLRLLGVNIDITQRKLAEQELHKSHDRLEKRVSERTAALTRSEHELREQTRMLQSILDSMADGVVVADRQGNFLLFNPAGERMLGLGATEGGPSEWSQTYGLFQLDGRTVYPAEQLPLAQAMRGEVVRNLEVLVRSAKAAADVIISVNAGPLLDDAGEIRGGVAVFRDVTEARRAQTALAESKMRLQTVVDNTPIVLWSVNQDGIITLSEGKALENLGLRPGEIVGQSAFEINSDDPQVLRQLRRALAGEELEDVSHVRGQHFQYHYVPIRADDGTILGANGVATDVTSRIRAEQALEQEQHVLRQMLELEDRERKLVANEIHDGFVQYVVGAHMRLDAVRERLAAGEEVPEGAMDTALKLLRKGIVEARRLISGLRPMIIDEVGLIGAIEHLIADRDFCQGVTVRFTHRMQRERLNPLLEATLLRIVQEAMTNIKRHSGSGRAEIQMTQDGDRLLLEIEDWGCGFNPASIPPARFGLRSIQERARLFGGNAKITSSKGAGTQIVVSVPMDAVSAEAPATETAVTHTAAI
ncbi:MAG: PAS domain S-box protein [Planctomycetia bacterium]|nr:PAS domain S-box protein [Planctomycetia bacterium]